MSLRLRNFYFFNTDGMTFFFFFCTRTVLTFSDVRHSTLTARSLDTDRDFK